MVECIVEVGKESIFELFEVLGNKVMDVVFDNFIVVLIMFKIVKFNIFFNV